MGLSKLESILGEHIEGFFNRKLSSAVEPAELARALEREMRKRKRKGDGGTVVPNDYTITLGTEDYRRLCSQRVLDTLYESAERTVIREGCFLDGTLHVRLGKKTDGQGICAVTARDGASPPKDSEEPHTLVLERQKFDAPLNLPRERELAWLRVAEGPDKDARLAIGERQVYVGRQEKNDFILTDANASRMHAYISYERHRHVLCDAGSLNGTYVAGKRIDRHVLAPGDEIRIGSTVLVYEVM